MPISAVWGKRAASLRRHAKAALVLDKQAWNRVDVDMSVKVVVGDPVPWWLVVG